LSEADLLVDVTVLDRKEMGELMNQQDVVLSF
jgi:sulfur relay (sulfurtransferase) DsrF/TusC family protein